LLEILTVVAVIGILSAVAIPQYNQYKIKGYDAHTKQALRDVNSLCSAYWLENDSSAACDLSIIKDPNYGFNQNPEVDVALNPSPMDNFCVSAKHKESPHTYKLGSNGSMSLGGNCNNRSLIKKPIDKNEPVNPPNTPRQPRKIRIPEPIVPKETTPDRPKTPIKPKDWECVAGGGTGGPGTLINSPGNMLHGWCVRMSKWPFGGEEYSIKSRRDNGNTSIGLTSPDGEYIDLGMNTPDWATKARSAHRAAIDDYIAKGNQIVVLDTGGERCNQKVMMRGSSFCAGANGQALSQFIKVAINDNGKLSEVEGSREGTFSQWNAKSNNERTQASSEERSDRGDPYCQRKLERLGVRFSNPSNGCP
jgi:type IV pilus assembly protein PilA